MGIPEGGGTVHEDCLGEPEAQINFRQFAGPPNSAMRRESATSRADRPAAQRGRSESRARSSTG